MSMYLLVNILGIIVYLAIALLFSKKKREINWKSTGIVLVLNLVIAWILTSFSWGRDAVQAAADGFNWLVQVAYTGINFALPNWVTPEFGGTAKSMNFVTSSLLPILLIVPLFDILTYIASCHGLSNGLAVDYQQSRVNQSSNHSSPLK